MNSDQGSHFTLNAYVELLSSRGVSKSMDGKARGVDNVFIERWFRTLKYDYLYINEFTSPKELRSGIDGFIGLYNEKRLHESLDYQTPVEVWSAAFQTLRQPEQWNDWFSSNGHGLLMIQNSVSKGFGQFLMSIARFSMA